MVAQYSAALQRMRCARVSRVAQERKGEVRLTVNRAVSVQVGVPDHLLNLLVRGALAEGEEHLAQLRGRDGAAVVLVEDLEGGDELLLGVGVFARRRGGLAHELEEFWRWGESAADRPSPACEGGFHGEERLTVEVDVAVTVGVDLLDQVLDLLDAGVQAKGLHGDLELLGVDAA